VDERARSTSILAVSATDVESLTRGAEESILDLVGQAYRVHAGGASSLPHSSFLRFPGDPVNRIIALPAYLGGPFGVAGIKWIASFPSNVDFGEPRASALLILNDCRTGRPLAVVEGSLISAQRTAASAALAARVLCAGRQPRSAGLVGNGVINLEIARFLRVAIPSIGRFLLHDLDAARAATAGEKLRESLPGVETEVVTDLVSLLSSEELISFATTAVEPHVADLTACPPGAVVLHVSLRDLSPEAILAADNVVDDVDHVCRARTSVHLAEMASGGRDFIRCTLADLLAETALPKADARRPTVFSPFGLGLLDLAVGQFVVERARAAGVGAEIPSFLP
jgi:ornithine cyclodeaminase